MSNTIKFSDITEVAIEMLSSYNVAWNTQKTINKKFKDGVTAAETVLASRLAKRQELIDSGMDSNEAIKQVNCLEESKALERAKTAQKEARKELNEKFSDGRALVSKDLYLSYVAYCNNGDIETFKAGLVGFLATLGITASTEWAKTGRFTDTLLARISGVKKATGKSREGGNYIKINAERSFQDIFILSFLQILVKEKGIFDINEDYTLSRHDFSKDTSSDEKSETPAA